MSPEKRLDPSGQAQSEVNRTSLPFLFGFLLNE